MDIRTEHFAKALVQHTAEKHLLKHPFYQAWEAGELDRDILRSYAKQYYHHVKSFPRYISATHSLCETLSERQVLLDNLHDEEFGEQNHPRLWLDFAQGLGATEEEAEGVELRPETQNLINTFFELARSSYIEGLVALFIYEQQIPAICETKIQGLNEFYGVTDSKTVEYFRLHHEVDILHSEATAELVNRLPEDVREKAVRAAERAAEALWGFLDGMQKERGVENCATSCAVH